MKKSNVFYIIYCVSVIVALAVFLVVKSQFEKPEEDEPAVQYATSMELNCDDSYSIPLGAKVTFSDYLSVSPDEFKYNVAYSLYLEEVEYNKNVFNNGTFAPTEQGNYKIKFTLPKSADENFVQVIHIVVAEPINYDPVKIIKSSLTMGDEIAFNNLFEVTMLHDDLTVEVNDNLSYGNNTFVAKSAGEGNIKIKLVRDNVEYEFNFAIEILEELPSYEIAVIDVYPNTQKTFCFISYTFIGENASTDVDVHVSNSNATVVTISGGIIKLKIENEGSVDVTISSTVYEGVSVTIELDLTTFVYTEK